MDGTLLNTQDRISENSLYIINNLIDSGINFTYATARSLSSASIVTKGLYTNLPVIIYNGAFIINPSTGEFLESHTFNNSHVDEIVNLLVKNNIFPLVYAFINENERVSWLTEKENDGFKRYITSRKGDKRLNPLTKVEELYQGNIFYFTCIGEKEELYPVYNILKGNPKFNCILHQELYCEEYWFEIMPKHATKAHAIRKLKDILKCDKIVSFGDALNDIPMFTISDECYAVENAVKELKAISTGVIKSNNEDAIAIWLKENSSIIKQQK